MKRFLCCLVVLGILISGCLPVMASEGKVEISFCVGDETLIINGSPVTVEKPYVVGEGVTLVPVRVITEAFDAKVDWIDETQTVKLTYPDVNIVIQIDNPVAEINGRAETLLAAPQLTESGYTMVPLRFISENFGADVSYDEETERITVVKEKSGDSSASIKGAVNSKYIGDSYLNWSMENPTDMTMEDRSFDGMETAFSNGENEIYIDIFTYDEEDFNFEAEYNEVMLSMSDLTLVSNVKDTSNKDCKKFHIGARDKEKYYDYQLLVTPKHIFIVTGVLKNDDTKVRDNYINILSTFMCTYRQNDIYDLSDVKDGFRKFESEYLKLSFDVPENFYMASSDGLQNQFCFKETENEISSIIASVYSKNSGETAKSFATEDYEHNKKTLNEQITTFDSGITEKQYGSISATEYSYTIKAKIESSHTRDVFFEVGDYIYNIAVTVELPHDNYDEFIDKIVNSVKAEPLNSSEVGVLIRNIPTASGTITGEIGKASITLPNIYVDLGSSDSSLTYVNSVNGIFVSCLKVPAKDVSELELKKSVRDSENSVKAEGAEIIKSVYEKTVGKQKYQAFLAKSSKEEEGTVYLEQLACLYKGDAYIFSIACSEEYYSESAQAEINDIIESIKFE